MTEYIPTPGDDELEATIGRLFDQLEDAREDSGILERTMHLGSRHLFSRR